MDDPFSNLSRFQSHTQKTFRQEIFFLKKILFYKFHANLMIISVTLSIDSFYQMLYLSKFQLHTIYWEGGTSIGGWCASPLLFTTHCQHMSFTQKSL